MVQVMYTHRYGKPLSSYPTIAVISCLLHFLGKAFCTSHGFFFVKILLLYTLIKLVVLFVVKPYVNLKIMLDDLKRLEIECFAINSTNLIFD